jgi:regulator of protease activity HflC (stomatin/prohibitin superfamily)
MEIIFVLSGILLLLVFMGIRIVPQSEEYVVERLRKYRKTLSAGVNVIIPVVDSIKHKISILERQLPDKEVSVITKDNVEIFVVTSVFFRIQDPAKSVYRIEDINQAISTTTESIIRSAGGKLELDEIQTSREQMSKEILESLDKAADEWGVDITRTEITDVIVDAETKEAQRQQLNAERDRRATVARAEGERQRVQLEADAELYQAEKEAQAEKVRAKAQAYAIETVAKSIKDNGKEAVNFEIAKRQVEAMATIGSAENTKTIVVPTDATKSLGGLAAALDTFKGVDK